MSGLLGDRSSFKIGLKAACDGRTDTPYDGKERPRCAERRAGKNSIALCMLTRDKKKSFESPNTHRFYRILLCSMATFL